MTYQITTSTTVSQDGIALFDQDKYHLQTGEQPHTGDDGLLIRSVNLHDTPLNPELLTIGRAGVGVNNIPLEKAVDQGVVVFNAPGANANGVKELVFAALVIGARPLMAGNAWVNHLKGQDIDVQVEAGKKAYVGTELLGKQLGVIGLGHVGGRVANGASSLAFGMHVVGYDPYIEVDTAWNLSHHIHHADTIEEVLRDSDYVTLHVPLTGETKEMINAQRIAMMKPGSVLLNFARDDVIDEQAILAALDRGQLRGYVTDFASPKLLHHPKVTVFPHIGGSTTAAETNSAKMVVQTMKNYLETGNIRNSVTFPDCVMQFAAPLRLTLIHKNVPNMVGRMTAILANYDLNIVNMMNRSQGDYAYTMIDLDHVAEKRLQRIATKLEQIENVIRVRVIEQPKR
ncbi:phosphoglycerate dehydrogenase [Loigolactobacillus bifermentans]|uniref:D-3-phosphoglycerate dehydrogenase n=1 Tax=Loigolactobacillus bifermentans DSM 20003 TaxID=1423726 RepID=A0A0R1GE03_9LACO|nr:phosphoglycerate dehydrogenase [Loigolactobacillus bifermentans]KRK32492.1 D-3-phosphoglycerate dehydrogenase [Loigolactobacillus bifermentans DSM 20003]QGG60172.1 3-phosphoglycerate dehydrogenase [Loigolactobacillus bifermentans]